MNPCSLGKILKDGLCHKTTLSRKIALNDFKGLSEEEQTLVLWRAQIKDKAGLMESICLHHHKLYLESAFTKKFSKCCNIFGHHSKKVKGAVTIRLELAQQLEKHSFQVIPGWKVCSKCYNKISKMKNPESDAESTSSQSVSSAASWEESYSTQSAKRKLDTSLAAVGVSPVSSSHALPKQARMLEAKKKITKVVRNLESSFSSSIGVSAPSLLDPPSTPSLEDFQSLQQAEIDYMCSLHSIKEKIVQSSNSREKIQLLTCAPIS